MQRALLGYADFSRVLPSVVDSFPSPSQAALRCLSCMLFVSRDARRAMRGQAFGASGPSSGFRLISASRRTEEPFIQFPTSGWARNLTAPQPACHADVDVVWTCARGLMRMT